MTIITPSLEYTEQQIAEMQYHLTDSNFYKRRDAEAMIRHAATKKGQSIFRDMSDGLGIEKYAATHGPMGVLRAIERVWDSPFAQHHLAQDRAALVELAQLSHTEPLDLFGREGEPFVGMRGHSAEEALNNPSYMTRLRDKKSLIKKLYTHFSPAVTNDGKKSNALIPAEELEKLQRVMDDRLGPLQQLVDHLRQHCGFDVDNWHRLGGIIELEQEGKMPQNALETLQQNQATIDDLQAQGIKIDLSTYKSEYSDKTVTRMISLDQFINLMNRPEWTAENIRWADGLLGNDTVFSLIIDDLAKEHDGDQGQGKDKPSMIDRLTYIFENRQDIEKHLKLLEEQGNRIAVAEGLKAGDFRLEGFYPTELAVIALIEVEALIKEVDQLPRNRQMPAAWLIGHFMWKSEMEQRNGKPVDLADPGLRMAILQEWAKERTEGSVKKALEQQREQREKQKQPDPEKEKTAAKQEADIAAFKKDHPDIEVTNFVELQARWESVRDLIAPENAEYVKAAVLIAHELGIAKLESSDINTVVHTLKKMGDKPINLTTLKTIYDIIRVGNDRYGAAWSIENALDYVRHFDKEQLALLSDGFDAAVLRRGDTEEVAAMATTRKRAQDYLKAINLLLKDSASLYLAERKTIPFNEDVVQLGPTILALAENGLADETSQLDDYFMRNHLRPLLDARYIMEHDKEEASKKVERAWFETVEPDTIIGHPRERDLFYMIIQTDGFRDFLGLGAKSGLRMIGADINLFSAEGMADFERGSTFRESGNFKLDPTYAAFRMYILDRQHDRVFSKLFDLGLKIDASSFEKTGISDFATWPELQVALNDPRVQQFIRDHGTLFSFVTPYDLVVIHGGILPYLERNPEFLGSEEFKDILTWFKGETESLVETKYRMNYYKFTPSMLMNILRMRDGGVDVAQAIDATEKWGNTVQEQVFLNDLKFIASGPLRTRTAVLIDRPHEAVERLDKAIQSVYAKPAYSSEFKYQDAEEEKLMTRPDLADMPHTDKIRVALLLHALQQPAFLQDVKNFALQSWQREIPLLFTYDDQRGYSLGQRKNLRGKELEEKSAQSYEHPDLHLGIMEAHTHPSSERNGGGREYANVPSGMQEESRGDIVTAENSRMQFVISLVTVPSHLAQLLNTRKEDDPSTLLFDQKTMEQVQINIDAYYWDKNGKKSNLDIGTF